VNLRFAKWEALISLVSGHDAKPTHLETPDEMDRNQSSLVLRDNRAVTPQNQPSPSAAELSAVVALKGRIIDVQKHMTMLSAGSVVGVATFLDKAFTRPVWKPLVAVSLVCFLGNIISKLLMIWLMLAFFSGNFVKMFAASRGTAEPLGGISDSPLFEPTITTATIVSLVSFGGGMLSLAVSFIWNFL
jgi:hypothetical protein